MSKARAHVTISISLLCRPVLPKKALDNGEHPELQHRGCIRLSQSPLASGSNKGLCGMLVEHAGLHLPDDIPQLQLDLNSSATAQKPPNVARKV